MKDLVEATGVEPASGNETQARQDRLPSGSVLQPVMEKQFLPDPSRRQQDGRTGSAGQESAAVDRCRGVFTADDHRTYGDVDLVDKIAGQEPKMDLPAPKLSTKAGVLGAGTLKTGSRLKG